MYVCLLVILSMQICSDKNCVFTMLRCRYMVSYIINWGFTMNYTQELYVKEKICVFIAYVIRNLNNQ